MATKLSIRRATRRDAAQVVPLLVAQLRGLDVMTPRADLESAMSAQDEAGGAGRFQAALASG